MQPTPWVPPGVHSVWTVLLLLGELRLELVSRGISLNGAPEVPKNVVNKQGGASQRARCPGEVGLLTCRGTLTLLRARGRFSREQAVCKDDKGPPCD